MTRFTLTALALTALMLVCEFYCLNWIVRDLL